MPRGIILRAATPCPNGLYFCIACGEQLSCTGFRLPHALKGGVSGSKDGSGSHMTSETLAMQNKAPGTSFLKRHRLKLIGVAVFLLLSTQMPLLGYLGRVVLSVLTFGVSSTTVKSIEVQTDWFKRYFTGPPSDAEMIAHFRAHRADLERLAYLMATQGFCHDRERKQPGQECSRIEQRIGMRGGMEGTMVDNSAFRHPRSHICGFPCKVQDYNFILKEPRQWWRTQNSDIEAWEKELVYVPPLLPPERFGLDASYPTDPVEVMRRNCYGNLVTSLYTIPAELERDPGSWGYPHCAVRHIEGQWFIKLSPSVKERRFF